MINVTTEGTIDSTVFDETTNIFTVTVDNMRTGTN